MHDARGAHGDVLVARNLFRLLYGALDPVSDERERRSPVDPLLRDRMADDEGRHAQGRAPTPPVGDVESPPPRHERPHLGVRLAEELGALCGETLKTISVPGSLYSVSPAEYQAKRRSPPSPTSPMFSFSFLDHRLLGASGNSLEIHHRFEILRKSPSGFLRNLKHSTRHWWQERAPAIAGGGLLLGRKLAAKWSAALARG